MTELRTPREWSALFGVDILDPDGWRTTDAPAFSAPITRGDFVRRMTVSTIRMFPLDMDVDPNEPQGGGCCGGGCG